MSRALTRYWFEFGDDDGPSGMGVTAYDEDDAIRLVRRWFTEAELGPPTIALRVVDVDVTTLPDEVRRHMLPPSWHGIWYPGGTVSPVGLER